MKGNIKDKGRRVVGDTRVQFKVRMRCLIRIMIAMNENIKDKSK